jgi:hypothetical protein
MAEAQFPPAGALLVRSGGVEVPLAPGKQRAPLLNTNQLVSVEEAHAFFHARLLSYRLVLRLATARRVMLYLSMVAFAGRVFIVL